jgi:hypothetical protein
MKKNKHKHVKNKPEGLLSKMDTFFEKHEKTFLRISLALGTVISILMFDCKVSLSGDDCDYIINAQNFIEHFTYPGGRGALYPIVISPFLIGGLKLILLKSLSAVFIVASMWLMYESFRGKVPASVLMPVLLITNLCPYIFFYASYTYSEPFFMFAQSLFIYLFSKYFWNSEQTGSLSLKTGWKKFLLIGLCFLAMGLTRTIGYAVMGAVITYFIFRRQWRNLFYSFAASGLVFIAFSLVKKVVWPASGAAYDINRYLARNFYNPEQGMEDLPGFIDRLIVNSNVYLSKFLYQFIGLGSTSTVPGEKPVLTVLTYVLFLVCITAVYKKSKPLFFVGLYAGVMNLVSFILLQTNWEQDRLIMIYYPLMLLFLLGGIYYLLKSGRFKNLTWIYPVLLAVLLAGTGVHLKVKVDGNLPVLQQNIAGNDLYGLTPDWENFIKMSRWADKNLDKNAVVASRKPSISYVYTGRNFAAIYNVPQASTDDVVKQSREEREQNIVLVIELKPENVYTALMPFTEYAITGRGKTFSIDGKDIASALVYKIPKSEFHNEITDALNTNGVTYTLDYDTFLKQYIEDASHSYQIISPDMLLKAIRDANIKYLLLPQLRIYTPQNTGRYINTIHQYIRYIQLKYPNSFRIIHTIGKEEICELAEYIGP